MIFDWDLWPWRVAEGAGPVPLAMYRAQRNFRTIALTIGEALLPAIQKANRAVAALAAAMQAAMGGAG